MLGLRMPAPPRGQPAVTARVQALTAPTSAGAAGATGWTPEQPSLLSDPVVASQSHHVAPAQTAAALM